MPGYRKERASSRRIAEQTLERAVRGLDRCGPWPEEGVVGLSLSGGADSTLLAMAWQRFEELQPGLRGRVWIVDHRHRTDSLDDAEDALDLYEEMGLDAEILSPERPPEHDSEAALRAIRYRLLGEAAEDAGSSVVLMAHQADDQAETLLLRLARGTGMRGLVGIPERRRLAPGVEIRRPLLKLRREEIRDCLWELDREWIEDPSNGNPVAARRNRVRRELLPLLAEVANGDPITALLRIAQDAHVWRDTEEELLARTEDWRDRPLHLRRAALADLLSAHGVRPGGARVTALEAALHARGSVALNESERIHVAGGQLVIRERRDPQVDGRQTRNAYA